MLRIVACWIFIYRVGYEGGELDGTQVLDNYQELLEQADKNLSVAFDLRPEAKLEVRSILEGNAFYNSPSLDGTRPRDILCSDQ